MIVSYSSILFRLNLLQGAKDGSMLEGYSRQYELQVALGMLYTDLVAA